MTLLSRSYIEIPEDETGSFWSSAIINHLTRTCKQYDDPTAEDVIIHFYEKKNNTYRIPRLYPIDKTYQVESHRTYGEDININFKSELRSDLQKQSVKYMIANDSGILKLKPGEGKTVISIAAICALKKKTIIFMHKDSLVTQWKERFIEHSDIHPDDVGILKTTGYKDILKKPIVISTVQTMCSIIKRIDTIEDDIKDANFGIGIWDECHTTSGAPEFSKTCYYIPAFKCFGLSATPARGDKNHDVISMHLGKVYEPEGSTTTMAPRVIMTYFNHMAVKCSSHYIYFGFPDKDGKFQKYSRFDGTRYKQMLNSKRNQEYIKMMKLIISFMVTSNRDILVINDRIKLLDAMAAGYDKETTGFFIPRSGKERDSDLQKKLVFSTPGSSRDGTDKPSFDCLILSSPLGNLDQAIGRVCRPMPGKPTPIVIDVVDTGCKEMVDWALKRKQYYQEKVASEGWIFEEKYIK